MPGSSSLTQRFHNIEKEFYTAAASGGEALRSFYRIWSALANDYLKAVDQSTVSDLEIQVAESVSSRIALVSEGLMDAENASEHITLAMEEAFRKLVSDIEPSSCSVTLPPRNHDPLPPPFISSAYTWLEHNLHDPYPSTTLKKTFAKQAGVTTRAIDDWFKNIRRRIGWISLCKNSFGGRRSLAIAAAGAVFGDGDDTSIPPQVVEQFQAIKFRLQDLYISERTKQNEPVQTQPLRGRQVVQGARRVVAGQPEHDTSLTPSPSFPLSRATPSTSSPMSRAPSLVYVSSDSEDDDPLPEAYSDAMDVQHIKANKNDVSPMAELQFSFDSQDYMMPTLASSQSLSPGPVLAQTPPDPHLITSMGANDARYATSGRGDNTSSMPSYGSSRKRRLSDSSDTKWSNKRPRTALFGIRAASDPCIGTTARLPVDVPHDSDFRVDDLLLSSDTPDTSLTQGIAYFSSAVRDADRTDNIPGQSTGAIICSDANKPMTANSSGSSATPMSLNSETMDKQSMTSATPAFEDASIGGINPFITSGNMLSTSYPPFTYTDDAQESSLGSNLTASTSSGIDSITPYHGNVESSTLGDLSSLFLDWETLTALDHDAEFMNLFPSLESGLHSGYGPADLTISPGYDIVQGSLLTDFSTEPPLLPFDLNNLIEF